MGYKVGDEVYVKAKVVEVDDGYVRIRTEGYGGRTFTVNFAGLNPKTYTQGLADAWELAKSMVVLPEYGGISNGDLVNMFGTFSPDKIFKGFTVKEALAKIEAYEKEKEIKVGDVVSDNCSFGLVTRKEGGLLYVMMADGSCGEDEEPESWHKTGKHIDIESLLKEIGE